MRSLLLIFSLFMMSFLAVKPVQRVRIDSLINRVHAVNDTTYIINFWATWCAPCVKELPVFDTIANKFAGKPVKVILVSLDFPKDVVGKLPNFIEKKGIKQEVLFLDELYENEWIPKVDSTWQGNIPATWIVNAKKKERHFFPREVGVVELDTLVRNTFK
jgi:thiol-disulfide isomerase/thioredoxin